MKTLRASMAAALLLAATRAVAHGPSSGAILPHVHPHGDTEVLYLGVLVLAVAVGVMVAMRASAKRR